MKNSWENVSNWAAQISQAKYLNFLFTVLSVQIISIKN